MESSAPSCRSNHEGAYASSPTGILAVDSEADASTALRIQFSMMAKLVDSVLRLSRNLALAMQPRLVI